MTTRLFQLLPAAAATILVAAAVAVPSSGATPDPASKPASPVTSASGTVTLYRIETVQLGTLWSSDHPLQTGDQVTFHQHPAGTLVSVRRSEIRRVSAERVAAHANGAVDIGITGGNGRRDAAPATGGKGAARAPVGPGERKDGTAVLNPDRKYQPDVDSKQVPGMNLAFPASPNDYREGKTFAYPAPGAVQSYPGDTPRMPDPPPPKPN